MAKKKATYLIDPEVDIMSLVELGANYTQTEDGKTVLLMKCAEKTNKETENMSELQDRKRQLEMELALINDSLKKEENAGEVGNQKPVDDKGENQSTQSTEKPNSVETVVGATGEINWQERANELEGQLNASKENEAALQAKIGELADAMTAYLEAEGASEPRSGAQEEK